MSSAANSVEVAVVGAGVIGLAIARALAIKGKEVVLIERASSVGSETSSRNSEVIHGNIYYPPSSWKARFCLRGNELLHRYCTERRIPHNPCGKLIVATHEDQWRFDLPRLFENAKQSGNEQVRMLSAADVSVLEPQVRCHGGALWSPTTGVLDSHTLMQQLLVDAEQHGAVLALQTIILDGKKEGRSIRLQTTEKDKLYCDYVFNCAGLWAHTISIEATTIPRQYFAKGHYFRLAGSAPLPFQRLIYPVPERGGLGVHATMDWANQSIKFGPNVEWVDASVWDPDEISYQENDRVQEQHATQFYHEVRKYFPDLPDDSLQHDYVGVRPKLYHPYTTRKYVQDFLILGPTQHGVDGLYHLLGMESPGLTASMAIAEHLANTIVPD